MKEILVVDIDRDTLEFIKTRLDAPNIRVTLAYGGESALERIRAKRFDLIISALEMPHPNGMDILVETRSRDERTPFIFLSKLFREDTDVRERLSSLGPYILLDKPIFMNSLYEAIEKLLEFKINWEERRKHFRYHIELIVEFHFTDHIGNFFNVKAKTVDLSLGGMSIFKKVCEACTGYTMGSVHSDCVLYKHSMLKSDSTALDFFIHLKHGEMVAIKGKVIHTIIDKEREILGIRFEEISEDALHKLKKFLKEQAG